MRRPRLSSFFLSSILFATLLALPAPAQAASAVSAAQGMVRAAARHAENSSADAAVHEAWDALSQTSLDELADISADAAEFQAKLPELTRQLGASLQPLTAEYQRLAAIAQVSRRFPAELTVVAERLRRQEEMLDAMTSPLDKAMAGLSERLDDLTALETDSAGNTPAAAFQREFQAKLGTARKQIGQLQTRITAALTPAQNLRRDVAALRQRLENSMTGLWRDYYLAPSGKILDPAAWSADLARLRSGRDLIALRMSTELPQTPTDLLFVLLRTLAFFVPAWVLLRFSLKPAARLPEPARQSWPRIARGGGLWLAFGLALYYAAWSGGNMYQIIASLGAMALCWGQMSLAWDLRLAGTPAAPESKTAKPASAKADNPPPSADADVPAVAESDAPATPRRSPLWPLWPPLFVGIFLLYFDAFPLLLATIWLFTLGLTLWRAHRRPPHPDRLVRVLQACCTGVFWISLAMTLFGFARLSILTCMAATALAVCVLQAVGLLRTGTALEAALPPEGGRALAGRLAIAIVVPLLLLLLSLLPTVWVLAYPGGPYLLEQIAQAGFNVGQVSLNAAQILSIFIAFYLTRSLISLGKTFITSIRKHYVNVSPALVGPFQTAYTYALWAVFLLYVLGSLGFSLTSLAIVAGGLSVGVGFGLQNIVQNFISGLMVIFGQVIREGDFIETAGVSGVVKRVNIRSTQVETFDNAVVFIPNSQFLSSTFTNWTHNGPTVRKDIAVGVAYGSDLTLCMKLLAQAAAEQPGVKKHPAPAVFFTDFAASSLNLLLRYWVRDINQGLGITTNIRLRVNELFAEHNIEISFPQLDVHVKTDPPAQV